MSREIRRVPLEGRKPRFEEYMPDFTGRDDLGYCMYETTSEGSPISPVFATPEEVARWLADNDASAFGSDTATYEQWLSVCLGGWAPSAVYSATSGLQSGVAAFADEEVETLRAQVEQLSDARHVPGLYSWHCPACQELHRVLGGAS